ncbi:hypothetical protein CROQUDRAFT_642778 [Cronartium quercuum f. sp. fusiforme G11]|uniref:TFIIS N-terminal domain-containing protein n=1 Tax=Cronartium quercuum f. sp. fusiforme G11 TaxID=708437 RepID=A0A9P6T9Y8_9BASI|nr:hypothetical protein CROQUDRAFT_642778 [Cronartium quercuum f. sp. fusiforme G11]
MMAQSPPTASQPAQAPSQTFAIDSGDPIWRHVKSDWDHQFIRRPNFIPWLRAQLEVDPIDEQSPNPEALVHYIKRRLALIQAQHPSLADGKVANSGGPPPARTDDTVTSGPPSRTQVGQSTGLPIASGNSRVPEVLQGPSPSHQHSQTFSQTALGSSGYTSQLGAIADAHMGSPTTAITPIHSLNSSAPVQLEHKAYHHNHVQHFNDQREQLNQPNHLHLQNQQRQQAQLPNQEYQPHHVHAQQPAQQSQPQILLYSHPTSSSPSPSTSSHPPGSLHPHNAESNGLNGTTQQFSHITASGSHGFYPFGNSPISQTLSSQAVDSMSLIHPNLISDGTPSMSLARQNLHPELGSNLPRIPPAASISFNAFATTEGSASSTPIESQVPLVDQPRTTRSHTAAAKKPNPIEKSNTSRSAKAKADSLAGSASVNGRSADKTAPSEPSPTTVHKPTDQYDRKAWKSRLSTVRAELDHIPKAPTRTGKKLIKILGVYTISPTPLSGDWSTVPPEGRLELLSAIRASANKEFFTAWAAESTGLGLLEAWLKGSVHAHERAKSRSSDDDTDSQERDAVLASLLQMLEKMPITVDHLKHHTFAKQVMRINKETNAQRFSDTVKAISKKLEQEWRAVVRDAGNKSGNNDTASRDVKKRNEPSPEPAQVKKRKVEVATKPSVAPTNSNTKATDMFFGKSDRLKLPAFSKKKPETIVSNPSPSTPAMDPFAAAMAALKERNSSLGLGEINMTTVTAPKAKTGGKPTKRVTFLPDDKLCQIKIVERLVYEGEEYETHPLGDARKMDAIEGRYLHHAEEFLEEEMEWVTPIEVVLTAETITNLETSPLDSPEVAIQEEREKTVVEVTYYDESQIPESPQEPPECDRGAEDGNGHIPKMIKLGGELLTDPDVPRWIAQAQADNTAPDAPVAPDHAVSDILARLTGGPLPAMAGGTQMAEQSAFPPGLDLNLLSSLSQAGSLQALLAASSQTTLAPTVPPLAAPLDPNPFRNGLRTDNGWGAAAGSGSVSNNHGMHIPTGPSAGVGGGGGGKKKGRKNRGKDRSDQRKYSAHDKFGRHIQCKWWPECPHGNRCYYKHGD